MANRFPLVSVGGATKELPSADTLPLVVLATTGQLQQGGTAGITSGYLRANSTNLASTTNLNPGILVYGGGAGIAAYGMDLGYNGTTSRYRNRLFMYGTAADFAFSASSDTPPTAQSGFSDLVVIRGDNGRVGVNTLDPSAKFHVVSTSEQFRAGYDGTHFVKCTVGSGGEAVWSGGTGIRHVFSEEVAIGNPGEGMVFKSPDGLTEKKLTIDNAGVPTWT